MNISTKLRSAFTLLEVTMASALMMGLMAMVLDSMVTARHLESIGWAKDELEFESSQILGAVSDSLTMSGWHLPASEDFNRDNVLTAEEDLDGDGQISVLTYSGMTAAQDRDAWYYPYVVIQDPNGALIDGLGTHFAHINRPPVAVVLPSLPATLPGNELPGSDVTRLFLSNDAAWKRSFQARSQELVFLKATIGQWDPTLDAFSPNKKSVTGSEDASYKAAVRRAGLHGRVLNFSFCDANLNGAIEPGERLTTTSWRTANNHDALGVLHACGWAEVLAGGGVLTGYSERTPNLPYGSILDAGWYDAAALGTDDDLPVKAQWETIIAPTFSAEDYEPSALREYTYAVVPSTLGYGRLVRAYKMRYTALPSGTVQGYEINNILPVRDPGNPAVSLAHAGGWCMRVDQVLSDNVVRITFDTYRTIDQGAASGLVTTLAPNQILVRVYLAKRQLSGQHTVISKRIETIISMRARSSQSDVRSVQTILGNSPVGIVH